MEIEKIIKPFTEAMQFDLLPLAFFLVGLTNFKEDNYLYGIFFIFMAYCFYVLGRIKYELKRKE